MSWPVETVMTRWFRKISLILASQLVIYCFQGSWSDKLIWQNLTYLHWQARWQLILCFTNPENTWIWSYLYPLWDWLNFTALLGVRWGESWRSRLLFTPHLSGGSSVLGQVVFRLRSRSARGWCSAPWREGASLGWCSGRGWPAGSRPLALRRLRSSAALCGLQWAKGERPAFPPHGAAVLCGETKGGSVGCWAPDRIVCPSGGVAHGWGGWKQEGHGSGLGRGLALLAQVWSGWGNHMDPSWKTKMFVRH